jgi:hypothetical protein
MCYKRCPNLRFYAVFAFGTEKMQLEILLYLLKNNLYRPAPFNTSGNSRIVVESKAKNCTKLTPSFRLADKNGEK